PNGNDSNGVLLAVSRSNDPSGTWDKYFLDIGVSTGFTDYDTLGVDDNGVYVAASSIPGSRKIVATPKASLIAASPSMGTLYQFSNITDMYSTPQPADNFDTVGISGQAWFVSSSATAAANLEYCTLTWSGGG